MAKYLASVSKRIFDEDNNTIGFKEIGNKELTNKQIILEEEKGNIVSVQRCISLDIIKVQDNKYKIEDTFNEDNIQSFVKWFNCNIDGKIETFSKNNNHLAVMKIDNEDHLELLSNLTLNEVKNYENYFVVFSFIDYNIPLRSEVFNTKKQAAIYEKMLLKTYDKDNLVNMNILSTLDYPLSTCLEFNIENVKFITENEFNNIRSEDEKPIDLIMNNNIVVSNKIFNDFDENKDNHISRVSYLPIVDKYMVTSLVNEDMIYHSSSVIELRDLRVLLKDQNINHCLSHLNKRSDEYIYMMDILKDNDKILKQGNKYAK